jgi:PAS domain S-box-containing protein
VSDNNKDDQSGKVNADDLFDAAPDATLLVGSDGRIERANAQAEKLFGYRRDELLGEPVELLIPQRFRNSHLKHRKSFADAPKIRTMGSSLDLFARRKDGTDIPIDVKLSPIRTRDRMVVVAAIRDITESQRIARELAAANEQLRTEKRFSDNLISTQQGIVLVLDSKGRITLANPYFEDLTGYKAGQLLGQDWFSTFIPEDERQTIKDFFAVVMREGINEGYINAIVTKNGEQRLIQWHSKTLENPAGDIIGVLNTGYDVTDREAAATELREAKEEAVRATAIKTRFLAAASHDVRQPLQSVGLYLSILSRKLEDPDVLNIATKMRQSLDSMGEIIDALLDISMLDSGSIVPEPRDFALQTILDQILADNAPYAQEKGLALCIEPTQLTAKSDPSLLARVIENLVGNAIRYTETGRVTVECVADGQKVRIEVSDTGVGIPQEALQTIFEEYFQLENPVRDRRKGLGLGLAIVRHIARLLDHELEVHSAPDKGSTFSVTLPLVGVVVESGTTDHQQKIPLAAGERIKVLIVDDDPAIVDATRMLLEVEGFDVTTALDGREAIGQIEDGLRPNIIVSDYRLPGLNGIDVIRHIRELAGEDLPTILVTGDTSAAHIAEAGLTFCEVLHKPVDSDQLIALISKSCA